MNKDDYDAITVCLRQAKEWHKPRGYKPVASALEGIDSVENWLAGYLSQSGHEAETFHLDCDVTQ